MHLPEWMARLLRETNTIVRDRDYERDQAAIDARLAPYRDQRYLEIPPDPRLLDATRLAALRDRLLNKYAYRWREVEAVDEIMDALFEQIPQSDSPPYTLGVATIHLNDKGQSPHPREPNWDNEFKLYYYITVHSLRPGPFLTSFHEADRLFRSILPEWGYTIRCEPAQTQVRLEKGDICRDWFSEGGVATLIITAALDLLAEHPEEIKQWRSL
jgi:hypothetical protein